jgi:hypothetical protein
MEDQVITSTTEPTIVESANTSADNTAGLSQVIDQATPMDSNITYSNLPKVEYQPNMTPTQNLINEAVQTEHAINQETNAGKAMNSFLTQGYDYDKNEAGSYWVAGAINDNNTQMSFLETLINEEMYDEMDLQKYYYDTNLATARAYAAQKGKETAYGFYRAAQERALAEGELTGWYMPAEGRYLLGQYTVAQNTLENPDATPEEISKANRVAKAAESWFSANQITTRGIKCLAMMNYEENVRHNNVMAALQKQANAIAAQGAAASAAGNDLQLRELKFQVEEMELQTGYDFSNAIGLDNNNYIGHKREDYPDLQALRGYEKTADMLANDVDAYAAVLGATNLKWIENILKAENKDPKDIHSKYEGRIGDTGLEQSIKDNGNILDESYLNKQTYEIDADADLKGLGNDRHVYTFTHTENGKGVTKAYYKDDNGIYHQIKDTDIKLKGGETIGDKVYNFSKGALTKDGSTIRVGAKQSYNKMAGSVSKNSKDYSGMGKNQRKTVEAKEAEGYKIKDGYKSTQGINADIVMEDDEGNLIEVSNVFGEAKSISKDQIKKLKFDDNVTSNDAEFASFREIGTMPEYKHGSFKEKNAKIYVAVDSEGKSHYYVYAGYVPSEIGTGHNTYDEIDSKTASKYVDNLDNIKQAKADYRNGVVTTKAGKNSDTIIQETEGSNKTNADIKLTSSNTGGSSTRNVDKTVYNPENTKATYNKYEIDTDGSPVLATLNEKEREDLQKNKINKVVI